MDVPVYGSTDYEYSSDEGSKIQEDTFQSALTRNQKKKLRKKNKKLQHKQLPISQHPKAEPVQYKPLAQQANILNTLISLIVHTALRVYSGILNSQDSLAEIFSLLEKKVGDTVDYKISHADQNPVNSGISH
ncbi:hypothetical protein RCL_jg11542.t1 [Rhizophagus clarus]|nr:hypothetical protein RCL_jg11542.t1 [Rhizophagus clarus]